MRLALVVLLCVAAPDARWSFADRPVRVYVGPTAAHYLAVVTWGTAIVNRAGGCALFGRPQLVSVTTVQAWFQAPGPGFRGTVLVQGDGEAEPARAYAEPVVYLRRRTLHAVVVTLPRAPVERWRVALAVLHELRHAAGYSEHTGDPASVSYPELVPGQGLTRDDLVELRRACR